MTKIDIAQISGFFTSGSETIFTGDLLISGSMIVSGSSEITDKLTIDGYDTFGDKNSPDAIDFGTY